MELIGSRPISGLLVSSRNTPEVRLLSSTGITRLLQYYEPVRHPTRPSLLLAEFSLRATISLRWGFPCSDDLLFQACRRHYPDGTAGCCRCLAQRHRPSPKLRRVGFRHMPFRGLLDVHSRFGLPVRSITQGDLYQSTSTHSLPPASPWLLPAERPIGRAGFAPAGNRRRSPRTGSSGVRRIG